MIYLDHAATTPLDERVLEAMLPWLRGGFGNASSLYRLGREARKAVEDAREEVAALIGARPAEIVFTSGGTESNTTALAGLAQARSGRGRHLITSQIEHHAVLHCLERLAQDGFEVDYLAPDADGRVAAEAVAERVRAETILVSVMHANNEVGSIQPIRAIGAACAARRVPLHCDAVQTVGHLPLDVAELGVALLSASAHKFGGPKGTGFLYIRSGVRPRPLLLGGGQERGRRAGTENVAGIVGLATALRLATAELATEAPRCAALRDQLVAGLLALPGVRLNGPAVERLPNNANLSFERVSAESLQILLDGHDIAVSTGSACSSGATEPSHVLQAMGLDRNVSFSALRFTVGRGNTPAEMAEVLSVMPAALDRLRALSLAGRPHPNPVQERDHVGREGADGP